MLNNNPLSKSANSLRSDRNLYKFLEEQSQNAQFFADKWISVTIPAPAIDPLAVAEQLQPEGDLYYWDKPDQELSIAAMGKQVEIKETGPERFQAVKYRSQELNKQISVYTRVAHMLSGPLMLGGYSFNDHNIGKVWNEFGSARFVLPEMIMIKSGMMHLLTIILKVNRKSTADTLLDEICTLSDKVSAVTGSLEFASFERNKESGKLTVHETSREAARWIRSIDKSKELINREVFEKIVIARQVAVETEHPVNTTCLIHRLRNEFPACYNFMVRLESGLTFLGATPERLISFHNHTILTEGLAGSISRGETASEDAAFAQSLINSSKDRGEHEFVVRAIRESLEDYSDTIDYPEEPQIKKLSNVQHLYTPISASVKKGIGIHDLLEHLHPTPAVGGFPARNAVPYIQEIEQMDRGWYAGPVGWFNLNGSGEFAVAIRSSLVQNTCATLFAGCGIVATSNPLKEWDETMLKLRPVLNALKEAESAHV
jgi:menaquinone-specific isochorismate synthase